MNSFGFNIAVIDFLYPLSNIFKRYQVNTVTKIIYKLNSYKRLFQLKSELNSEMRSLIKTIKFTWNIQSPLERL